MIPYCGRHPQFFLPARWTAGYEGVIDEHHPMADEAIAADGNEFADEAVRLYARPRANGHAALDFDERTDEAVVADLAVVDVDRFDDFNIGAESHASDANLLENWLIGNFCVHGASPRRHWRGLNLSWTSRPVSMDSYSALISDRLLRPSNPSTKALLELRRQSITCS